MKQCLDEKIALSSAMANRILDETIERWNVLASRIADLTSRHRMELEEKNGTIANLQVKEFEGIMWFVNEKLWTKMIKITRWVDVT